MTTQRNILTAVLSVRLIPGVLAGNELSRSRLDIKNWNLLMSKPTELPDTDPPDPTPESRLPPYNFKENDQLFWALTHLKNLFSNQTFLKKKLNVSHQAFTCNISTKKNLK